MPDTFESLEKASALSSIGGEIRGSENLTRWGAAEIARRIAVREVTSAEVVEAHIRRIEAVNGRLNALVVPLFAEARTAAKAADAAQQAGQSLGPYFIHGLGHSVGLNVHDPMDYNRPLEPGMVITMEPGVTHGGTKKNLIGDKPDEKMVELYSNEKQVTAETPPTFIFQTNEDTTVPAENAIYYYLALRKAGVPAEMHVFEKGAHGVGLANDNPALSAWSPLLANWLRGRGVIK